MGAAASRLCHFIVIALPDDQPRMGIVVRFTIQVRIYPRRVCGCNPAAFCVVVAVDVRDNRARAYSRRSTVPAGRKDQLSRIHGGNLPRRMSLIGSLATAALPLSRALLLPHEAAASRRPPQSLPGRVSARRSTSRQPATTAGRRYRGGAAYWGIDSSQAQVRQPCALTAWGSA